ncbi:isopentenyl-diphosphate Delta-isomerase [Agromyces bauzanensis]|uniref:Isopentenyl-diphosphate Delta-isomerase n=1 Tax=Agromyces bauzanensis TaxID=1308924 RepID=A0A917PBD5_9MICO|nr:isopentenyl-diphosphate Delta-isomerase [Agromyces bauzanensis]GGJ69330.1 isopentenyl-diphosphate Delta-isomerase [Agromyces bauzanensis]
MTQTIEAIEDEVVLLDEAGNPIGRAPKSAAHGPDTALHLAFSCHVVNALGELLVTRRALTKQAWPGVWTNSFCGHPRPAESLVAAVRRRADFELGIELDDVELALPLFRYRAADADGTVENEVCPVYLARTASEPDPNPREVAEYRWVDPAELGRAVEAAPWAFSPWLVLQARQLELFRD